MQAHPLARWIDSAGVKRTDFARKIGCSPGHLTMVTTRRRGVSLELATNIERATKGKVTTEQLLRHGPIRAQATEAAE